MFCPKCRTRYIDEQLLCRECNVNLVPELPPLPAPVLANFSRLHSPSSSSELLMIKNILSREKINFYTTNDKYGPDFELNKGCMIMVQDGHIEKARKLLMDFQIDVKRPPNSVLGKWSALDNPRRTIMDRLFGWAPLRKKK